MLIIPTRAVPSQIVNVTLGGQSCRLDIRQRATGLFIDVYVNDAVIVAGVLCLNLNRIVRSVYLGFIGDLAFVDAAGNADPDYALLGSRYFLAYLAPNEI